MALIDFTTYDEVRAALGVSSTEVSDTVLAQSQWAFQGLLDLEDINTAMPAMYTTIAAISSGSRTTEQQRYYDLCRIFMTYAIAKSLLGSLPLFSAKRLTDGKAEFDRFSDAYKEIAEAIFAMFNSLRYRLGAAYQVLVPGASVATTYTSTLTVAVGLAVDPVTTTV